MVIAEALIALPILAGPKPTPTPAPKYRGSENRRKGKPTTPMPTAGPVEKGKASLLEEVGNVSFSEW